MKKTHGAHHKVTTQTEECTFVAVSILQKDFKWYVYTSLIISVHIRRRKGEKERARGRKYLEKERARRREILKEERYSVYCLSPNRLKQDVDGRYSKEKGEYQWKPGRQVNCTSSCCPRPNWLWFSRRYHSEQVKMKNHYTYKPFVNSTPKQPLPLLPPHQ